MKLWSVRAVKVVPAEKMSLPVLIDWLTYRSLKVS